MNNYLKVQLTVMDHVIWRLELWFLSQVSNTDQPKFILISSRSAKNCNGLTFPRVLEPSKLFLYGYSGAKILDLDILVWYWIPFSFPPCERKIKFATRGEFYGIFGGFNCTRKIERRKDFNCFGNDEFGFIFYVYVCEPGRFWIKSEFLSDVKM